VLGVCPRYVCAWSVSEVCVCLLLCVAKMATEIFTECLVSAGREVLGRLVLVTRVGDSCW